MPATPPSRHRPKAAPAPPAAPAAASVEAAYEQLSKRFASVLKAADGEAQALIDKARAESTKLLEDARIEADKIRVDAQANAEETRAKSAAELERAREEADRVLGGLEHAGRRCCSRCTTCSHALLDVAKELEVPDDAPAAAGGARGDAGTADRPRLPASRSRRLRSRRRRRRRRPTAAPAPAASRCRHSARSRRPPPAPIGQATEDDEDLVDPRYEDLWASTEARSVDIPDLSALDIDFDDERE